MKKIICFGLSIAFALSAATALAINESDELPVTGVKLYTSSTNANQGVPCEGPERAIDGDLQTHWHTMISPKAENPHFITMELPEATYVSGYRYYPRSDGGAGICTEYEIWLSLDGNAFKKAASGTWEAGTSAKTVKFDKNYRVKFVRLQMIASGNGYGSAGEIRVLAAESGKENSEITSLSDIGKLSDTKVSLFSDELPVDGWTFDTSSTNANKGVPCEVPENTIDGDTKSHWHTMISPKAAGPHYITIILPNEQEVSGYRYYPRSSGLAGICMQYEISVSSNGTDFAKIAEGSWSLDTEAKTANFGMNVRVKAVKLVILDGKDGYGSAGEIRLLKAVEGQNTLSAEEYIEDFKDNYVSGVQFAGTAVRADMPSSNSPAIMVDGNSSTYWHSIISQKGEVGIPVNLDFIFKYPYTFNGIRYVPRQDGNLTGHFKEFEIFTSDDGVNFNSLGVYTFDKYDTSSKDIVFDKPVKTQYFRIYLMQGKGNYGTCAELSFLQSETQRLKDDESDTEKYMLTIDKGVIESDKWGVKTSTKIDAAPFISDGYTMIPLRGLLELMGASVTWNGENQTIEVKSLITEMTFRIEDDRVMIDNERYNSAVAPMIKNGRTYIPLRFVSESMGYNVSWNNDTREITIEK